ncbi:hypothetical protein M405DRAFT_382066 [Rhizopogon salebrosus TDB-379]|nr:hypothetical protein M405DRAFT_382066 [Rhizopogon salebrosus TDB-379]
MTIREFSTTQSFTASNYLRAVGRPLWDAQTGEDLILGSLVALKGSTSLTWRRSKERRGCERCTLLERFDARSVVVEITVPFSHIIMLSSKR